MAVTAYKLPGTADQSVKGATAWSNLSRILLNDSSGANNGFTIDDFIERYAHLVINGVIITAVNKGADAILGTPWSKTYGGAADLWSQTITPATVNDPDFGVAFAIGNRTFGGVKTDMSYFAIATNFGFAIPSDATINGIEMIAEGDKYAAGGGTSGMILDSIQLRVHYTWPAKVRAEGSSSGFVYSAIVQDRPEPQKRFRYISLDKNDTYLGELTKRVENAPSFKYQINNLLGSMSIRLAQNEKALEPTVETLLTETDEVITTEQDEELLADLAAAVGVGPGSTTDVNNNMELIAYYGDFEELLTEDGHIMLTESDEIIMIEEGAPQGDKLFTGYVPEWELDFGSSEDVDIELLSHSNELANTMLETSDVSKVAAGTFSSAYWGIKGSGPDDRQRLFQTFTMVGSVPVSRIRLKARTTYLDTTIPVTLTLVTGTVPGTPGTTLAVATANIVFFGDDVAAWHDLNFIFDQVALTNGTVYGFFLDVDISKTGGSAVYPAQFQAGGTGYAGGALYVESDPVTPVWALGSEDLVFEVFQPGGATTVTFNSMDPGNILKAIIDFARLRGARANYDSSSIELTGTTVSLTIKTNNIVEAFQAVLKVCPSDWYGYYDFGDNIVHLHPRSDGPDRLFTKGRDVKSLKIKRSIKHLVNDVYFSGGGSPSLFIRKTDQTSITNWRRGLAKLSDNRVTDQATAEILAQAEIDRYGDSVYSGALKMIRVDEDRLEAVTIGENDGFVGFGMLVDALRLQIVDFTYRPDDLDITLNMLLPRVEKRIEDIKRNLSELEQADNPTSPTVT